MTPGLVRSFGNAFRGLGGALKTQRNLRIHLGFTLAVVAVGWFLALSSLEWAILALTVGLVWVAELLNTAVEWAADLASPGWSPLAKMAKDVAAASVLVAALTAVAVGLIIFLPHLVGKLP